MTSNLPAVNKSILTEEEAKQNINKDNTGNISKKNREELLSKIKDIRKYISTAPQDENTANLLSYLSDIEKDINGKKYGLIFEAHREDIDEVLNNNIPVLSEDKELYIDNGGQMNFLIEGDNLASLKLLLKTHKGKIDFIYIDPPYNTGNEDFMYNDHFIDQNDGYRHSSWSSFMAERLKLAKELLNTKAYIAISIDENEFAPLKLICDDIFGEENMLSNHHIKVRYDNKNLNEKNDWQPVMEYVLIYAKSKIKFKANKPSVEYNLDKFAYSFKELSEGTTIELGGKKVTIFKKGEWEINKNSTGSVNFLKQTWASGSVLKGNTSGKFFDTYISKRKDMDGINCLYKVENIGDDGLGYRYFVGPQKESSIRGTFYSGVPLDRLEELKNGISNKTRPIINYYDFSPDFGNIRQEGDVPFNKGKKPVVMLKQLINYSLNKDGIILDFFAGSGSTAQAVLDLNSEDSGNRKFIMCTNNENNICKDITYKRIANVINGYKKHRPISASLKYYTIKYLPISDRMYYEYADELLKYVRELVELENGINFNGTVEIAIVLTDEELEEFVSSGQKLSSCQKLYMGHDILPTSEQQEKLRNNKIEINIIPDYYYSDLEEV